MSRLQMGFCMGMEAPVRSQDAMRIPAPCEYGASALSRFGSSRLQEPFHSVDFVLHSLLLVDPRAQADRG